MYKLKNALHDGKSKSRRLVTSLLLCLSPVFANSVVAQEPQSLTFANFRDTRDLNPHIYSGEIWAQNMLYESLVKVTPQGIEPWLAEKWETSADGKVYTFTLRSDVKFSDGAAFNAQTAKQNIDAILDNRERHGWLEMVRIIDKVEALDEHRLRFTLKEAYYPFLIELAVTRPMRFISPAAMKEGGTRHGVNAYIGTGPYVMSEHKTDEYAVFTLNPLYWGEKPKLEKVVMKVIPDTQTRLLALQKGEIELIYGKNMIDADAFERLSKDKKFTTQLSEPVSTRMLLMNTTSENLKDMRVRQALQHAVNKVDIAEGIFNGSEVPADTLLAKNVPYSNIDLKPYAYDLDQAKKLLDAAGWQQKSGQTWRQKEGKPLSVGIYYDSNTASQKVIAEYLQNEFAELGIELKLHGEEEQAYRDRQKAGKFDIVFNISWGTPYDPQSFLSGMKLPVYGDYAAQQGLTQKTQIDSSITRALITTDEKERQELYRYVLTTLHEEAVYIPLTYERNRAVHVKSLKGVAFNPSQFEIPFDRMYRD
ncbi:MULTISPECIES: nickel ABC transporter substrate-binding protein [unclassified Brenneria]|uniref:nickel ABC transporter substrate-binding protein n=1 Tax=unclassified Brenneria TaxID=2634434 RepID=UPI00155307E3|nr:MULTISPECIES: nickel ABC transporter substrate-binding protein [unclassified Brenneria]MBJ7222379.1 nickel ABC transporter, nickel/metallophore periplasmic binding protein [Brenneria sp. L3-3C-1]MEE3643622.1 nickel ABC transporter substrate-binding protein [Brenneria sp. L3_3C_1]MEE3651330.1 nickel ABC transporter substrate-binding protein [Brenneria sp. HEZEL_4_2_4]NPD01286.1 nickel ABC transporter, nickel/metallophore periplasmic binding protein [Brenneria sp. hezel4-2-4]